MKVHSPIGGVLEWRTELGAVVSERTVLGWIAGPGRCGLIAVEAGAAGRVTWRRHGALEITWQGEAVALIDGEEDELRSCRLMERESVLRALEALEQELGLLEAKGPLGEALLGPQRQATVEKLAVLRTLCKD